MSSIRSFFIVVILSLSAVQASAQDAKLDTKALSAEFEKIMASENVKKTKVGVYAVDVESGALLIDIKGDEAFNPASNAKIITSAVALEKFGASKTWATRLSAGSFKDGVVNTLYVKSDGDPMLLFEDFVNWAIILKQKGVKKVTGGIVVDDGAFSDQLPPGFDQQDEDASYRPDIGSFSVNYNMVSVVVEPTSSGKKPVIYMRPPQDHVTLEANVKTDSRRTANITTSVKKTKTGTTITLNGTIGNVAPRWVARKRIDYPSLYAASVLKNALTTVGIEVEGESKVGKRPDKSKTLHFHLSQPLWHVISLMNKYSNNFIAEQLFMLLGSSKTAPASADKARTEIDKFLKSAGVDVKGLKAFNGSGLYVGNEISPKQIVTILRYMSTRDSYPEFAASMAVAGGDGTLRSRLRKDRGSIRGKTGTLSKVSALSGYAKTKSGRLIAFSVLFNDPPIHGARMRAIQDAMVERLANFSK